MLSEIKKITEYIKTDEGWKTIRKRMLLILLVFVVLLLLNRFVFLGFAAKSEFYLSLVRTKVAVTGNASVYNIKIDPAAEELRQHGIEGPVKDTGFVLPLFALIFYLPFTYIKDFSWSLALWLTSNQVLCFFIINSLLKILDWKVKEIYKYYAAGITLLLFFMIENIFSINLSIIQLFLIIFGIQKVFERELIIGGILLGLALIDPYQLFIPLIMIFFLNIHQHRGTVNIWIFISFILFSLLLVIFDMQWVLELVKKLFFEARIYPLISYRSYLSGVFPDIDTSFSEIIPLFIFFWSVIEYLRTPKETHLQELWLICFSMTITPLMNMWESTYSTVAYLMVFCYTLSLWYPRMNKKFTVFAASLYAILLIAAPFARMIAIKGILPVGSTYIFNILTTIILFLNLYWVRLWVINPYYSINKIDEI